MRYSYMALEQNLYSQKQPYCAHTKKVLQDAQRNKDKERHQSLMITRVG